MRIILLSLIISLSGCMTSTGIVSIGEDTYMIGKSSNLSPTAAGIKADAIKEASQYCQKHNKNIQIISAKSRDMRLGKNVGSTEIQFMCLSEGDSELNRPKLKKEADKVIEVKSNIQLKEGKSQDKYSELKKLNELKKLGIITQEEFETEKKKILNQ